MSGGTESSPGVGAKRLGAASPTAPGRPERLRWIQISERVSFLGISRSWVSAIFSGGAAGGTIRRGRRGCRSDHQSHLPVRRVAASDSERRPYTSPGFPACLTHSAPAAPAALLPEHASAL